METITLQQDAADKITVSLSEDTIIRELRKFFGWRKDVTVSRFNRLGTCDHDKFIAHLKKKFK